MCRRLGSAWLRSGVVLLGVLLLIGGCSSDGSTERAVDYLTRYGYLPPSGDGTGNLRTDSQLRGAIRAMQRFGNIPDTGRVDEATLRLMRRPRCGMPDVAGPVLRRKRRYAVQGQKWPGTNLSWTVRTSEEGARTDSRMIRGQLRRAFGVWSSASALVFREVEGDTADIVVSFLKGSHGDGYPFDGEGAVLAHAFFPGEGIGGDAHFDAEERWLAVQPRDEDEGVNLFAVAAHEIGHSLGLSHSSTPGSLMFPYYQVVGDRFKLPKDDADGIRYLYGIRGANNQPTMPTISPFSKAEVSTRMIRPSTTTEAPQGTAEPPTRVPDVCDTELDAISVIRREVFVFKGKHFWRLDVNRTLKQGYPVTIDRLWHNLTSDIDALYERPTDTKIVFFAGKQYWLFSANQPESGYPRPITDLGLPEDLERLDAAMVWGHNGKTYLFGGSQYWKLDEADGRVELDYPRNMSAWRGVPHNIDAAFQWTDGNTYFFKGQKFWKFVDAKMRVERRAPSDIGRFWFRCKRKGGDVDPPRTTPRPSVLQNPVDTHSGSVVAYLSLYCLTLMTIAHILNRKSHFHHLIC